MKTLKRLVSSLLVFSMIASMFLTVTATTNNSKLSTQTTQKVGDYETVDNIYIDGKLDMDIKAISTVLSSSQSYSDVLGYNARLDSVYFPSIIELQHQSDPGNNGKLVAAVAIGETKSGDPVPSVGAILESTDGGQSWNIIFRPVETIRPEFWAGQMAHIYELPAQVGDMPAGTLIYSANTVNYNMYSHISAWRSFDAGETWQQYTVIAQGGGLEWGVWEPVMFYDNGYLYCFYSDDRHDAEGSPEGAAPGPDQKLVYQRSIDGVNWEAPVDVYSPTTLTDRPGMPVITKMGNGEYFLVYENGKVGDDCYVYYKTTNDITNWNASDPGTLLIAKVDGKDYKMASSPGCVWSPAGGSNGTLFAMGRRESGGDGTIRMFVSFDYGNTWDTIRNPLPYDWYTSASAGADGNDSIGYRPIMVLGADPSVIHYINITETDYVKGSQARYAKLKIYDDDNPNEGKNIENYQKKIVFKVINGRWNDGTTADKVVYVTLSHNGRWNTSGSATLDVPAVGGKPGASFKAGSWDTTPPTTVSGLESVTYTYTYEFDTAKTLSVGSESVDIGSVRTVHSNSTGPHFPSIVELKHQSDPSNNGKLIAAMSVADAPDTMARIVQSTDGGATWSVLSHPVETINRSVWGGSMAHIYELPDQVGNMPAGTLIYSATTVNYDYYSHLGVWASDDCGQTWTEISVVAIGGGLALGVWEPVMFYDNGYLYCFYSDDRGDGITAPDQKLVYQRSKDGITWEAPVDICSLDDYAARPGMPVVTKMGNGEYFLVYEYVYPNAPSYVYYKKTNDITNWNASDMGTCISVESGDKTYYPAAAPACVWTPAGGDCGMLFATGQYQCGGVPYSCVFVSLDYGTTWNIMENPLPYANYSGYVANDLNGYRPIMVLGTDPSVIHYINMTTNTEVQYVTLRANDDGNPNQGKNPLDYQKKVIFKVVNGKWNDGTTDDKILYVTLEKDGVWDTSGSAVISIPAVGNLPYTNFRSGKWVITPSKSVSGTQDVTYTYVYAHDPYENCVNAFGPVLAPAVVNGICWELSGGNLKMPAGHENSFLLFSDKLVNNRIEATIVINDNTSGDSAHRNGIVFALTDHDGDLNFNYDGTDVSYYWAFINDWGCVEVVEMGKYQNWHWLSTSGTDLSTLGIDVTQGVTLAAEWDTEGNIRVYANAVLVQDITDSTPLTGNYYGLLVNKYGNYDPSYGAYNAPVTSFVADIAAYENCTDASGNLLTPVLVNDICWELSDGNLKMPAGHANSFLLFGDELANNRIEATIVVNDNIGGDSGHRNGIVFALTDHDGDLSFNYDGTDVSYYWAFINDWGCVEVIEMGKYQNWQWLSTSGVDLSTLGIDVTQGVTLAAEWNNAGRIRVYANGILVQDITDTTPLTGNYYGLLVNKYGNTQGPDYEYPYDAPVTSFVAGEALANLSKEVNLGGSVTLTGKTLVDDMFTFELYSTDGTLLQSVTNKNDKFGFTLEYTATDAGKTFYYVVKQVVGTQGGVTYDVTEYSITVTVLEEDGTVEAMTTVHGGVTLDNLNFVNSYAVTGEVAVDLSGNVTLTGKTLADDMFTFELYDANSSFATSTSPRTATNVNGKFAFTFSYAVDDIGTHYYVLRQAKAGTTLNGITYDDTEYSITVKVEDNGNGGLKATVIGVTANALDFANSYAVTGTAQVDLSGNVTLIGETLTDGMFTFELYGANASFVISTSPDTTTNANGKFAFELNYNASDVGKTYYYVLRQANAGEVVNGISYSSKTYRLTVMLEDNGLGAVKTTVTVDGGVALNALNFENTIKYSVAVDCEGNLLTPRFVNDIYWELSDGNLKMPAGPASSFLLFGDALANNRIEATIVVNDNISGDSGHRNGLVFALTDHDGDLNFNYDGTDVSYYWAFINDWGCVEVIEMGKYQNWQWLSTSGVDLSTLGIDVTQGVTLAAEWDNYGHIKVYANGILVQDITDSTPLTGNYYGMLVNKYGNTQGPDYEYPYNAPVTSFIAGESFADFEGNVTIGGNVILTGKTLTDDMFTFELYSTDGTLLQSVTNESGKFAFTIGYTEADAGKTFNYVVKQANGGQIDMTYDTAEYYVSVILLKNHGGIEVIATVAGEVALDALDFENSIKYLVAADSEGNLLTPVFVNDIYWELSNGNLKMPAGPENSFLLFGDELANNRIEATIVVNDNISGDSGHRNGLVFALTDHDGDLNFNYDGTDVSYYWAFINDWGYVEVIEMGKYQSWHWLSTSGVDLSTLGIDVTQGVTLAAEWDAEGNIRVYANGILVQDITDTTPLTGNYYGMLVNKYGNTQGADYEYPYNAPVTSFIAGESFADFEGNVTIGGNVTLTGKTLADDMFTFELYSTDGALLQSVTNESGKFAFTIGYTEADAGKTFNYIVKQANGGQIDITYDTAEYYVSVILLKNHGGIEVIATVEGEVALDALDFENSIKYLVAADSEGNLLTPVFVNDIYWELSNGNLKMPAGPENSFLLFGDELANNRIEATIVVNDNIGGDSAHRNGLVFALTDHDGDLSFNYDGTDVSYYWAFINDWGCVEVIEMGKYQNWHWLSTSGVDLSTLGIDVTQGVTLAAEWDAEGNIRVYANGILVHDITDSTPLTGNYYGMLVNKWGNTQGSDYEYPYNAPVTSFIAG